MLPLKIINAYQCYFEVNFLDRIHTPQLCCQIYKILLIYSVTFKNSSVNCIVKTPHTHGNCIYCSIALKGQTVGVDMNAASHLEKFNCQKWTWIHNYEQSSDVPEGFTVIQMNINDQGSESSEATSMIAVFHEYSSTKKTLFHWQPNSMRTVLNHRWTFMKTHTYAWLNSMWSGWN